VGVLTQGTGVPSATEPRHVFVCRRCGLVLRLVNPPKAGFLECPHCHVRLESRGIVQLPKGCCGGA
jgi:hypothetical protein